MEKLINVENDWDGELDFPEVLSLRKKRLQQLLKDYELEKQLRLLVW